MNLLHRVGHVLDGFVVFACFEFAAACLEGVEGVFHVFEGVNGGGDDTQDDLALRDHGVNDHGAEEVVVFAQIDHDIRSVFHAAFHVDGGHGRLGHADVETGFDEAFLEGANDGPEFFAIFGMGLDQFEAFHGAADTE